MTLIATLVTNNVLVQVSDRRLTWLYPNGKTAPKDDTSNKAILYQNRAMFAFTGFAELEGEPTDQWVAKRLAQCSPNLNDSLELITTDLTVLFQKPHYRGHGHGIVIAVWKRNGVDEPTPMSGIISNFHLTGIGWSPTVLPVFDWFLTPARPELPTLVFAPPIVHEQDAKSLFRQLLRVKAKGLNITNAVRLIAQTFQTVASYRPTVGRELLASVLPRSAVPRTDGTALNVSHLYVNPHTPTFWTITARGDLIQYSPTMIMNSAIISNVRIQQRHPGFDSAYMEIGVDGLSETP